MSSKIRLYYNKLELIKYCMNTLCV